jgi:rhamnosyltransferase
MLENSEIFTVLVAYNRTRRDLSEAVEELLKQSSFVVICNNSKDDLIFNHPRIKVLNFGDNLGIAKAQNIGMAWAFDQGADFILQMDHDSLPDPDMVKLLHESYSALHSANYNVGIIGPRDYDRYTKKIHSTKLNPASCQKGKFIDGFDGLVIVNSIISSGSLISRKSYLEVGEMLDELFIDAVDFEYCWRLRAKGFLIVRNDKAKIAHRFGEGRKSFLGIFDVAVASPIRHYYQFRNVVYLFNRTYVPIEWKIRSILKMIFKMLFYPLFLNNGMDRLKFMALGVKDGLINKMYRIDQKRII